MSDSSTPQDNDTTPSADDPWATPARTAGEPHAGTGKRKVVAGVVAALLLLGGGGGAYAAMSATDSDATASASSPADGRQGGRPTSGAITAIDGSTLTVKVTSMDGSTSDTTTKVSTSDATVFTKSAVGAFSAIKVGDNVSVRGTTSGTTVTASNITDSGTLAATDGFGGGMGGTPPSGGGGQPPSGAAGGGQMGTPPEGGAGGGTPHSGGAMGGGTTGTVKSISGSTLIVTTSSGDVIVNTSSATTVTVTTKIALSDLKVGDTVTVQGTESNGTLAATTVRSGTAMTFGRRSTTTTVG